MFSFTPSKGGVGCRTCVRVSFVALLFASAFTKSAAHSLVHRSVPLLSGKRGTIVPFQPQRSVVDEARVFNEVKHTISETRAFRQRLRNIGDAQYTGVITLGQQRLNAVVDSGSFELLALGAQCPNCGTKSLLYDAHKSPQHVGSTFEIEHTFGSGTTTSLEAHDELQIGHIEVPGQMFWEVKEAQMPILLDNTFQAILGIGPPGTIAKFAEEDAKEVHDELDEYEAKGYKPTETVLATVRHYDDRLEQSRQSKSFVQNSGLENASVCLGKEAGSEGYMVWNDHSTIQHPEKFATVDVVGEYYWSTNMSTAKFGGLGEDRQLGCWDQDCTAIVDTGTSLIAAPDEVVRKIHERFTQWQEAGGSCDDVSALPAIEFNLGGVPFSLPPESYVGGVWGNPHAAIAKHMPHLVESNNVSNCHPLVMTMDDDGEESAGPAWILGMPFFRKYYTSFHFEHDNGAVPRAAAMSFSVADDSCQPSSSPADMGREQLLGSVIKAHIPRKASLNIDASKIRVPRLPRRRYSRKHKKHHLLKHLDV